MFKFKTKKGNFKIKDDNSKNKFIILSVLSFSFATIIGIILFKKSNSDILCLIIPIFIVFDIWMLLSNKIKDLLLKQDNEKLAKQYLMFFEFFYYYSSLENSYYLGFKEAINSLETSEIKNKLIEFIEDDTKKSSLPFKNDILPRQDEIIEQCQRLFYSKEEFNKNDSEKLKKLIFEAKNN